MRASVQAREKLSHCDAAGSVQGLDRISRSVFSAVTIIQAKGKMTRMVQKASKSWDTALKVKPPNPSRAPANCAPVVERARSPVRITSTFIVYRLLPLVSNQNSY